MHWPSWNSPRLQPAVADSRAARSPRRCGGRDAKKHLQSRAEQIQAALRAPQLEQAAGHRRRFRPVTVSAYVALLAGSVTQIRSLEGQLETSFGRHPDAEIVLSTNPGSAPSWAPGCLPSSATHPHRYADPKARKNYAGTAPITRAVREPAKSCWPGSRTNKRLRDALYLQAFTALNTSPGARAYYDQRRAQGHTHHQALRAVSNRLVGILHGCLRHHITYDEADRLAPLPTTAGPDGRLTLTDVGCLVAARRRPLDDGRKRDQ